MPELEGRNARDAAATRMLVGGWLRVMATATGTLGGSIGSHLRCDARDIRVHHERDREHQGQHRSGETHHSSILIVAARWVKPAPAVRDGGR